MARYYFSPAAEKDLYSIGAFIAEDKPNAADNWIAKIEKACELLATRPRIGESHLTLRIKYARVISVGNYVIIYREVDGDVEIARVVYGGSDFRNL